MEKRAPPGVALFLQGRKVVGDINSQPENNTSLVSCMEIKAEEKDNVLILQVSEDHLDASNSKDFKQCVTPRIQANPNLVLDMQTLKFVDSSGLGAILSCLRQATSLGGDIKLCCITKSVRLLFELVRMHRIVEVYETKEDAMSAFS